ncbi:alpha/beta hydrolase family protein [Pseudoduganella violaceinigra]|uniref:alpha/beta hydrolase family protein n=1 Tax=Pseudoduganella violaceinigra TaxID=246602 RepID=UPI0012B56C74|nr:prolyl oligopeptidase family serine peptidase [Pseudoduganella violaceinigra]
MRLPRLAFSLLAAGAALQAAAAPDAAAYFRDPALHDAAMAPDGRHVGMLLTNESGRTMVGVMAAQSQKLAPAFSYSNADVVGASWINSNRLLLTVANVNNSGNPVPKGIIALDRDGSGYAEVAPLVPHSERFAQPGRHLFSGSTDSDGWLRSSLGAHDIFVTSVYENGARVLSRLDTRGGNMTLLFAPFERLSGDADSGRNYTLDRLVDEKGRLSVALIQRDGRHLLQQQDGGGDWLPLANFAPGAADAIAPLLHLNGKLYVAARNGQDTTGIYRFDPAQRKLGAEPLISIPGNDAEGQFIVGGGRILGFRTSAGPRTTIWYDAALRAAQQQVDAALPNTVNTLLPAARAELPYLLLSAESYREPASYYLYHSVSGKLVRIGDSLPGIDPKTAPERIAGSVKLAGGMDMPVWLSVPAARAGKTLPLVLLLGEKAWQRAQPESWNAAESFLTAQGFAVLQLDPRGTYGYGARYFEAGWQQWGKGLQDDLAAAVKWAAAQGVADPERVCAAGTGFGGYAAVLATALQPDMFKCALSWSPQVDPAMLQQREDRCDCQPPLHTPLGQIGGASQPALLDPQRKYARPVLLAYGKDDGAALARYAPQLAQLLKAGNAQSDVLAYEQPGRQTALAANRIDFWNKAAAFLARQIGGPLQP